MTGPAVTTPDLQRETRETLDRLLSGAHWRQDIEKYISKNVKLKRKLEDAEAKLQTALDSAPKDGARTITKEQAEEFDAFVALKIPVKDLKPKLDNLTKLEEKDRETTEAKLFADAAKALGYKNEAAVSRFLIREKLELEFRDTTVKHEDGSRSVEKLPFVRPKGDDKGQFVSLEDYLNDEVPELISAFETAPATDDGEEGAEGEEGGEEDTEAMVRRVSNEAADRIRKSPTGGVRIAATKGRREAAPASTQTAKVLAQAEEDARNSGNYAI